MDHTAFTDSSGVQWTVSEDGGDESHAYTRDSGSPGSAWLRFESELEVRRLWHYPDDWRGLSGIQLESLLDRASTVIARFRPVAHRRTPSDTERAPATGASLSARPPVRTADLGSQRPGTRREDPDSG